MRSNQMINMCIFPMPVVMDNAMLCLRVRQGMHCTLTTVLTLITASGNVAPSSSMAGFVVTARARVASNLSQFWHSLAMGNMLASGLATLLFKMGFYKKNAKVILLGAHLYEASSSVLEVRM